MYSILRTPHPPTGVEHAVEAHFFGPWERNLVVGGANVLRVFRLMPAEKVASSSRKQIQPDVDDRTGVVTVDGQPVKMRLECLASFSLNGEIADLQKITLAGSTRDTFLISFPDAKLSVVEYDPETHDLRTISLHIFEDAESRDGYVQNISLPYVRADPEGRCAAMLIYGRKVVILPFKKDTAGSSAVGGGDPAASSAATSTAATGDRSVGGGPTTRVMSSYILDLKSVVPANKVDNIIDIQFLHGYSQPTLTILYEPMRTWPGRASIRKDTCRLDVITLDVNERVSAFIWSKEVLPFDCVRVLPVPEPIGGILVFAVNNLFYLNQGVPPYGVSLNSLGDNIDNVVSQMDGVKLTLDCAQAQFITPERAVISLKGGELYVLSLMLDGLRSVRGFHFDRAAASVLTTCLAACEDSYLFLGSRLGNSLLLQFTEKDIDVTGTGDQRFRKPGEKDQPPTKKKRTDASGDWMASDVGDIEDIDFEVYGHDTQTPAKKTKITSYTFEVCDSLLNIGPCGHVSMGEPAFISEEFTSTTKADPDVELVSTSGHGKNGALCVLQQTVRPQVVTTFELPGCTDMWTVVGESAVNDGHAFLILSRSDSTMVLQTGEEINELDNSGFQTKVPTIYTGNIGNNKYIIQVTSNEARLLHGSNLLQKLPIELGNSPIVQVSCEDPHLLALTADGQLVLLSLDEGVGIGQLILLKANLKSRSKIMQICAYKDTSGLFTNDKPSIAGHNRHESNHQQTHERNQPQHGVGGVGSVNRPLEDDEDDLLYGDSAPNLASSGGGAGGSAASTNSSMSRGPLMEEPFHSKTTRQTNAPLWLKYLKPSQATFWAVLLRENGNLELLSLPDFTLRFAVNDFPLMPLVLIDSLSIALRRSLAVSEETPRTSFPEGTPAVVEILMVGLGGNRRRPLLMARTSDHEVAVYEAFPYYGDLDKEQLKVRFKKVPHGLILRERKGRSKKSERNPGSQKQLRYFGDVASYEGVFLCGPYPHWLLLTSRGELRTHPMPIDGSIPCFAAFHNINCPQGFIYFNRKNELRISVLPTHLSYDAPWPVRKVPLRCTPHFVAYHLESKTYAVVTSTAQQSNQVWKFNGDDKELFDEERDERFPLPFRDTFSLQLFSPVSWESIPGTTVALDDWERCTSLKHLHLSSEGLHSGQRGYVVCSTAYSYGEDVTPRGYIRIYDVIEVIPEPGKPLTKNKFKAVYEKEQKGPITAISAVNGYLVATEGQKIYVYKFKDRELFGLAFIDSQIYIHQLVSLKNFILVGDVMKSVDLLQFQEDFRTLAVISRDPNPVEVYAVQFLVDNTTCSFAVTDSNKNLSLYMYLPDDRDSVGGQRLVRKADFHIGQHVNTMFRIRAKITDPSAGSRLLTGWEKRQVLWFATLDGGLGYVLPCSEKTYRRLLMLQNVLVTAIPHVAGLNPKSFRTLKQRRRNLTNPARSIIDGELVFKFIDLPVTQKAEIAKRIGTKFTDLMDDLAVLDRMASHF